jgi:predicted HTH transcriptional regulator
MHSRVHFSQLRNLLVAETFYRMGAVETWGCGTKRVIAVCKRHGGAPPTFEGSRGFVLVTPLRAESGYEEGCVRGASPSRHETPAAAG